MTKDTNTKPLLIGAEALAKLPEDPMQRLLPFPLVAFIIGLEDGKPQPIQVKYDYVISKVPSAGKVLNRLMRAYIRDAHAEREFHDRIVQNAAPSAKAYTNTAQLDAQRRHLVELQRKIEETKTRIAELEKADAALSDSEIKRHEMKAGIVKMEAQRSLDILNTELDTAIQPVEDMENAMARAGIKLPGSQQQ